tara:strand:+ start:376 stop:867 length:492 start_codon:yes stop_codon:yes gene_type:complete
MVLTDSEKFQLKKMIEANDTTDMTDKIRENQHSTMIRDAINMLIKLKNENMNLFLNDKKAFEELAMPFCGFLFQHYTDIYNKIMKDEVDIKILNKLLDILKKIEDNVLDQHEASFMVGTILKEMYVDSAIKKAEKLDEESEKNKKPIIQPKKITWMEFKKNLV